MAVATFSGTDQTTPCPVGDAVFNNTLTTATSALLTPTNLTANDASVGGVVNDTAGNPLSYTPNNIYVNTGTAVNLAMGYATGTTGVTANMTGPVVWACVAIRIAAAAGGGGALNSHSLLLLGVGQ
jgi:hypothetical protein